MSAHTRNNSTDRSPLVRLRQLIMVIAGIAAIFSIPLLLVWKQTYIRGSSVRLEAMADTLSAFDKELSFLRLKSERLSNTERIESFARVSLGLDYPSSDRMVIVSLDKENNGPSGKPGGRSKELFAAAKGGPK